MIEGQDPAGGCGKKYEYIYGCCGEDHDYGVDGLSWGAEFLVALGVLSGVYLSAGTYLRAQGARRSLVPHAAFWQQVAGLTRDGVAFCSDQARETVAAAESQERLLAAGPEGDTGSNGVTHVLPQAAGRSTPTALHTEAATGNAVRMVALLSTASAEQLNAGDRRGWTPFHCAAAGGHAECVRLLLGAGCDTTLLNDNRMTGWELAGELRRSEVLALKSLEQRVVRTPRANKDQKKQKKASPKKKSKKKSPAVSPAPAHAAAASSPVPAATPGRIVL